MKVNNLLLAYKENITNLIGHCHGIIDIIHFKIRTIRKMFASEKKFKKNDYFLFITQFSLMNYEKKSYKKSNIF